MDHDAVRSDDSADLCEEFGEVPHVLQDVGAEHDVERSSPKRQTPSVHWEDVVVAGRGYVDINGSDEMASASQCARLPSVPGTDLEDAGVLRD